MNLDPRELTTGMMALFVAYFLIRDIITPLIRRALTGDRRKTGGGSGGKSAGQIDDLHRWHAPNEDGRQVWKDIAPVVDGLTRVEKAVNRLGDQLAAQREVGDD